jgi:hypothetical protein
LPSIEYASRRIRVWTSSKFRVALTPMKAVSSVNRQARRWSTAEAFSREDPFILEGLVKSFVIRDWNDSMLT